MNRTEMNALLGEDERSLDAIGEEYEHDEWDAEQLGTPIMGRPALFGEAMASVAFKEPRPTIVQIDARAAQLGMRRSEYLRHLVDEDLRLAGML